MSYQGTGNSNVRIPEESVGVTDQVNQEADIQLPRSLKESSKSARGAAAVESENSTEAHSGWAHLLEGERETFGFRWDVGVEMKPSQEALIRVRQFYLKTDVRAEHSPFFIWNVLFLAISVTAYPVMYVLTHVASVDLPSLLVEPQLLLSRTVEELREALFNVDRLELLCRDDGVSLSNSERLTSYLAVEVVIAVMGQGLAKVASLVAPSRKSGELVVNSGSLMSFFPVFILEIVLLSLYSLLTLTYLFPLPPSLIARSLWFLVIVVVGVATVIVPVYRALLIQSLSRQELMFRRRLLGRRVVECEKRLSEIVPLSRNAEEQVLSPPLPMRTRVQAAVRAYAVLWAFCLGIAAVMHIFEAVAWTGLRAPLYILFLCFVLAVVLMPAEAPLLSIFNSGDLIDKIASSLIAFLFLLLRMVVLCAAPPLRDYGDWRVLLYLMPLTALSYLPYLLSQRIYYEGIVNRRLVSLVREHRRLEADLAASWSILRDLPSNWSIDRSA